MTVDLAAVLNDTPIKELEIKALEKTDSPYEYRIIDKDVISALENVTAWAITEAYIVDCGDIEAEWAIVVYFDIPCEIQLLVEDSRVFNVTRMEGTPADLV